MLPDLVALAEHAGVGTMGSAEGVVDVNVTQLCQAFTELLDLEDDITIRCHSKEYVSLFRL